MKSTIFKLKLYFTILIVFVLTLSITGFAVISSIPVEHKLNNQWNWLIQSAQFKIR